MGVYAQGKFTKIAGTLIRIEKVVDAFRIVSRGFYNFPIFYFESYIFVSETLLIGRRVIGNAATHGILYRGGVDFSVRDVHSAVALDGADTFDGEGEICSRPQDLDLVRPVHQFHQRVHSTAHLPIVDGGDVIPASCAMEALGYLSTAHLVWSIK